MSRLSQGWVSPLSPFPPVTHSWVPSSSCPTPYRTPPNRLPPKGPGGTDNSHRKPFRREPQSHWQSTCMPCGPLCPLRLGSPGRQAAQAWMTGNQSALLGLVYSLPHRPLAGAHPVGFLVPASDWILTLEYCWLESINCMLFSEMWPYQSGRAEIRGHIQINHSTRHVWLCL